MSANMLNPKAFSPSEMNLRADSLEKGAGGGEKLIEKIQKHVLEQEKTRLENKVSTSVLSVRDIAQEPALLAARRGERTGPNMENLVRLSYSSDKAVQPLDREEKKRA